MSETTVRGRLIIEVEGQERVIQLGDTIERVTQKTETSTLKTVKSFGNLVHIGTAAYILYYRLVIASDAITMP